MIKPINGSWIEFQHENKAEGKYWNSYCANFDEKQWDEKIREQAELGFEYLVLMASALNETAYYDTNIYPKSPIKCINPIETFLSAADKYNIKFFISSGFFFNLREINSYNTNEVVSRHLKAINEIAEKFYHHKSFYGWYFPIEAFINKYFQDEYIDNVNKQSSEVRKITPDAKILIAPFGTNVCSPDDKYIHQLEVLDVDYIAYQDEIGVQKSKIEDLSRYYEGLKKAHDKAQRSLLWADVEIFEFEGTVYKSALLPSCIDRISRQLEVISPFADNILVYQYLGMMNKPGTNAFAGHKDSTEFYSGYYKWLENNFPQKIKKILYTE